MANLKELDWQGMKLEEHLIIPIIGQPEDWLEHDGTLLDVLDPDQPGGKHDAVTLIWDDDKDVLSPVGYAFVRARWNEADAKEFVAQQLGEGKEDTAVAPAGEVILQAIQQAMAKTEEPSLSRIYYLSRMVDLLQTLVPKAKFEQIKRQAKAYAGGKLHHKGQKEEAEPEPEEEPVVEAPLLQAASSSHVNSGAMAVASSWATNEEPKAYEDEQGVWKCISRVGTVYHAISGKPATITEEMLHSVYHSFGKVVQYVDVPMGHHFDSPDKNTGFIRKLMLKEDPKGLQLWGLFDFTEPEIKNKVLRGTIADCSIWIEPDLVEPSTGRKHAWSLWHVCLTNKPVMTQLGHFSHDANLLVAGRAAPIFTSLMPQDGAKERIKMAAAKFDVGATVTVTDDPLLAGKIVFVKESKEGVNVYALIDSTGVQQGSWYLEEQLEEGDPTALAEGAAAAPAVPAAPTGFALDRLDDAAVEQVLAARGFSLAGIQKNKDTARENKIERIVLALEGKVEMDGVKQEKGYAHYPFVIQAVEKALREEPAAKKFSIEMDGACSLDEVLLSVVNAIPAEGRMVTTTKFALPRNESNVQESKGEKLPGREYSKEELEAFEASLPHSRTRRTRTDRTAAAK